jgi:hypothetical protein
MEGGSTPAHLRKGVMRAGVHVYHSCCNSYTSDLDSNISFLFILPLCLSNILCCRAKLALAV